MKTLNKGLDILEYVSAAGGLPVTPSQVAAELQINVSSCVRMMQTLCERGYLMQLSRRGNYVTGPNLTTYSCRHSLFNSLVAGAREPMKKLSDRIHALVNLSVVHCDRRYLIYYCGYTPGISVRTLVNYPRHWNYAENATERLLLAAADRKERERIVGEIGVPENFTSMEDFFQELDRLRKAGTVKFHSRMQKLWIAGGLVLTRKYPPATIGFGVPTEPEADFAVRAVAECCAEIRANLEPPDGLFPG